MVPVETAQSNTSFSSSPSVPFPMLHIPFNQSLFPLPPLISYPSRFSLLARIITPYNHYAFEAFLSSFGLTKQFPTLVESIKNGFRIGVPNSYLADSIIPPYRASDEDGEIDAYLSEEIAAGRMDGPFTESEMRELCGGHFAACPVHVVTQTDEKGKVKKRVVRNMSYAGEQGYSVNDLINSDDFPTQWGSAPVVADIVSCHI